MYTRNLNMKSIPIGNDGRYSDPAMGYVTRLKSRNGLNVWKMENCWNNVDQENNLLVNYKGTIKTLGKIK